MNVAHTDVQAITDRQESILFPALRSELSGDEEHLLDLGCGSGRFTASLADLIGGSAVGIDPIQELLDLAPDSPRVRYERMEPGQIPLPAEAVDVVWTTLVLGGITDGDLLAATIAEIDRVLRPGGLLFVAEATSNRRDGSYWHFRTTDEYIALLSFAQPSLKLRYTDLEDQVSVLCGRKGVTLPPPSAPQRGTP